MEWFSLNGTHGFGCALDYQYLLLLLLSSAIQNGPGTDYMENEIRYALSMFDILAMAAQSDGQGHFTFQWEQATSSHFCNGNKGPNVASPQFERWSLANRILFFLTLGWTRLPTAESPLHRQAGWRRRADRVRKLVVGRWHSRPVHKRCMHASTFYPLFSSDVLLCFSGESGFL